MDFYVDLAITVLLRILKDRTTSRRYYPALAKVFVAIRDLADLDKNLAAEIQHRTPGV
jgi:hypothetical protein